MSLSPNSLAFVALSNEYCAAVEGVSQVADSRTFVATMLRLLPRIYIVASDLAPAPSLDEDAPYLDSYLSEDYYEEACESIRTLLGTDDVYLETFEEDMKYSETPVAASVAEGLCDIFQELYNFISVVRDAHESQINDALIAVKNDFESFWSQQVVNVLRPLNQLRYNGDDDGYDDESGNPSADEDGIDLM